MITLQGMSLKICKTKGLLDYLPRALEVLVCPCSTLYIETGILQSSAHRLYSNISCLSQEEI